MIYTRLSEREYQSLCYALQNITGSVYLFGSRTDVNRRGGDIDVLIVGDYLPKDTLQIKLSIQRKFVAQTDQKLDIVVLPTYRDQKQELFFNSLSKIDRGQVQPMKGSLFSSVNM